MDAGLKGRTNDPLQAKLDEATHGIGELVMGNELRHREREARRPTVLRKSLR